MKPIVNKDSSSPVLEGDLPLRRDSLLLSDVFAIQARQEADELLSLHQRNALYDQVDRNKNFLVEEVWEYSTRFAWLHEMDLEIQRRKNLRKQLKDGELNPDYLDYTKVSKIDGLDLTASGVRKCFKYGWIKPRRLHVLKRHPFFSGVRPPTPVSINFHQCREIIYWVKREVFGEKPKVAPTIFQLLFLIAAHRQSKPADLPVPGSWQGCP